VSERPVTVKLAPITIATWNLWWRFGKFEHRQEPIAQVLAAANADIVCLQEVWAKEDDRDQAAWLGDRLRLFTSRHDTATRDGLSFANAVLSRWPIVASTNTALPGPDGKPSHRKVLHATLDTPRGAMHVLVTHLDQRFDNSAVRSAQLKVIAELAASIPRDPATDFPVILAGDLNAVPDSDEVRTLTGRRPPFVPGMVFTDAWEVAGTTGDPGWTWRADNPVLVGQAQWPNRRLDYVMTSWPRTSGQGTPETARLIGTAPIDGVMASDHAGLLVSLR
jgi:endonuclease/exonuclease/phosphatase family metal-dependent hydrolase